MRFSWPVDLLSISANRDAMCMPRCLPMSICSGCVNRHTTGFLSILYWVILATSTTCFGLNIPSSCATRIYNIKEY